MTREFKLGLFTECERLTKTKLPGLQLNADKTEFLALISIIGARGNSPIR